jgi:hypothetical protein
MRVMFEVTNPVETEHAMTTPGCRRIACVWPIRSPLETGDMDPPAQGNASQIALHLEDRLISLSRHILESTRNRPCQGHPSS